VNTPASPADARCPACSRRHGLDACGLPLSLQFVTPPFREALLLRVAHGSERAAAE